MKKFLVISLAIVLSCSLVACGNNKNNNQASANNQFSTSIVENSEENNVATKTYIAKEDMNVYKMFQIVHLDENPTTGYTWTFSVEDESIAVVEGDEYTSSQNDPNLVGVGGEHTYRISGVKQGQTNITFMRIQSWEGISSASEKVTLTLNVNEDNEIAITNEVHG